MEAIDLLMNRSSQPRLQAPAPQGEVLARILQSGLRAPDHACLSPWRFIVCQGEGLTRLGEIYQHAAVSSNMSERDIERSISLPNRAPMVIVAISQFVEHPKVPWVEQVASASCAVQSMQMAALAQGFGGVWRTGSYARNQYVKDAFKLSDNDEIVGFLYLGTPISPVEAKPAKDVGSFVEFWGENSI